MSLGEHYERKYAEEELMSLPARNDAPADRYAVARRTLPSLLPERASILEFGAGSGTLARMLLADGVSVDRYVATELAETRLRLLRQIDGIEARVLDAEKADRELGVFDAVIMIAVIEHLVDPLHALGRIREMLRPGGFVWIDTPNIAKWTRRLKLLAGRFPSTAAYEEGLTTYEGATVDLHDEGHLHYFTFRSLERMLLERCGFERIVRHPYAITPMPLGYRIHAQLTRHLPTLFSEVCISAYSPR